MVGRGGGVLGVGQRQSEIAHYIEVVAERLQRREGRAQLERSRRGGCPTVHNRPVRHEIEPESRVRRLPARRVGLAIDSSSGSAMQTPAPCKNVRRDRRFFRR